MERRWIRRPVCGQGGSTRTERAVVAQGRIENTRWRLAVYEQNGDVCAYIQFEEQDDEGGLNAGGSGGDGAAVPDEFALGTDVGGGARQVFVSGVAREDVSNVRVELISGEVIEVATVGHDVGDGIGVFAVPIPGDDAALSGVGVDDEGRPVARQQLRSIGRPQPVPG